MLTKVISSVFVAILYYFCEDCKSKIMKSIDFNFAYCQIKAIMVVRLNMTSYSVLFLLLITVSGLLALTIAPALSDNPAQSPKRQVRVTTGIGAVQGWEQGLVEKNPNLGRWHWDPIYYYKQGYGPVTSRSLKGDSRLTGKQANPANPVNRSGPTSMSYQIPVWHDAKPVHIPYSPQAMAELHGRLFVPGKSPESPITSKESVLGKLMNQSVKGDPIATYNNILPERENSLNTGLKYSSQSTAVYGQLLNSKAVHKNHSSPNQQRRKWR